MGKVKQWGLYLNYVCVETSMADNGRLMIGCLARLYNRVNIVRVMYNSGTFTFPYLLTPWCRVLLEKLIGLRLVKKFPGFHGTRRFITALTSVRHQSLSWASPIQSIYPHPTSRKPILIFPTHLCLGLPSGLLPSGFQVL